MKNQVDKKILVIINDIYFSSSARLDRAIYDTPFWDGYGADNGSVCVNSKCYNRTEVNYFAQGMCSAKYEGNALGQLIAHVWKYKEYGHGASEEVIFWVEAGYDFYHEQQNCYACYGYLK